MYEVFAKLLQEKGITPYRVYKETGVAQSSLSDWKNGKGTPSAEKLKKIADYLCVSVDYLLTGDEPIEKPAPQTEDELNAEIIKLYGLLNAKNQDAVLEIAKSLLSTQ